MKAMLMDEFGDPPKMAFRDADDPVAAEGEVVVDIHATTVNPVDWKIATGARQAVLKLGLPHVLGVDFSGVVAATGPGVDDLKAGDEVFGVGPQDRWGSYAEKIAISAGMVGLKPASLSHVEAAALALIGLTALVSLEDVARLSRGQKILIHAGAGGVGGFALQFAKFVGAHVITTASAGNTDYVKSLGADEVIDYTAQDFAEIVSGCDVVYDTIGGEVHRRSFAVLKPGGKLIHIAPPPPDMTSPRDDVTVIRPQVDRDRAHMDRICELVAEGAVRPPEIKTMTLAETEAAHVLSKAGHVRGKIVLTVR